MRIREYWTALPVIFHGFLVVCDASLCSFLVGFFHFKFFSVWSTSSNKRNKNIVVLTFHAKCRGC